MTKTAERAGGFTLIEVVVAMAIIAVGMAAVFVTIGAIARNVDHLRDRSLAAWIADNRIAEMRLAGELPSVDETDGEVDFAGRRWHWVATVSQTPVDGLRRIDVSVRRDSDPEDSALVTLAGFAGAAAMAAAPSTTSWSGSSRPGRDGDGDGDGEEP